MNQRTGKLGRGEREGRVIEMKGGGKGIEIQGERGTQSLWTEVTLHAVHIDLAEAR